MKISIRDIENLRKAVADSKTQADKAEGVKDQLVKRLKTDYNCSNMKQAKAKLAKLKDSFDKLDEAFTEAYKAFSEKWERHLEE